MRSIPPALPWKALAEPQPEREYIVVLTFPPPNRQSKLPRLAGYARKRRKRLHPRPDGVIGCSRAGVQPAPAHRPPDRTEPELFRDGVSLAPPDLSRVEDVNGVCRADRLGSEIGLPTHARLRGVSLSRRGSSLAIGLEPGPAGKRRH